MTDEDYRDLQAKALAAAALLESDAWALAEAAVRAAVTSEWSNAAWTAPTVRDQKFAEIRGLQMVRDRLQGWINDSRYEFEQREKRRLRAV